MKEEFIKVSWGDAEDGYAPIRLARRFPCRAQRFVPTNAYGPIYALRSVTHVPTGTQIMRDLEPRVAQIICAVLDRILPGDTQQQVLAAFIELPLPLRKWILSLKYGGYR